MALGTRMRGLVAVLGLCATSTCADACHGFTGKDEIAAVTLSPGLKSDHILQEATLSWEFPSEVCLNRWVIELSPLDGGSQSVSFYEDAEARIAIITSSEIQPGVIYRIGIKMEFAPGRFGPEKSIEAVPMTQCNESGVPGVPSKLYVKDQTWQGYNVVNDSMDLCWASNCEQTGGCPDEFTVALRVQPSSPADLFDDRHAWRFEKMPIAGCHRLNGIEAGTMYDIGITAYNAASMASSSVALIREYAADRWQCVKGDFYTNRGDHVTYDWCDAAKNGQCTPMTCDEIADAGMCGHSSVRRYDPETLTVIQYCSSRCSCTVPSNDEIRKIPSMQPDSNQWACCRSS